MVDLRSIDLIKRLIRRPTMKQIEIREIKERFPRGSLTDNQLMIEYDETLKHLLVQSSTGSIASYAQEPEETLYITIDGTNCDIVLTAPEESEEYGQIKAQGDGVELLCYLPGSQIVASIEKGKIDHAVWKRVVPVLGDV